MGVLGELKWPFLPMNCGKVVLDVTRTHLKNAKWPDLGVRLES